MGVTLRFSIFMFSGPILIGVGDRGPRANTQLQTKQTKLYKSKNKKRFIRSIFNLSMQALGPYFLLQI